MHVGMWMIWLACSAKQEEPDLLIPPVGYDVNTVVEAEGFRLCVETQPTNASIRVSSREVSDCLTVKGEVFVEVDADGFIPYRELLQVDADLTHQVMLVPKPSEGAAIDYPMPQKESPPTSFIAPSSPIELCVNVTPEDAFLRINGVKRPGGSCTQVQNAAEVRVEANGYAPYRELLSISPEQGSPYTIEIVLVPTEVKQPL